MDFHLHQDQLSVRVALCGRLTFAQHGAFRDVVARLDDLGEAVVLDLAEVDFIDSAGLGMLLVAREQVARRGGRISLCNATGQVGRMLALAKFGDFFAIDD